MSGCEESGCEDLDVCHKFFLKLSLASFIQKRFVCVDHSVCDEEFVITINYDKNQFGHLIHEYVCEFLKEIKKS